MKHSKRYNHAYSMYDRQKRFEIDEALKIMKTIPASKFDETVEMHFNLGVDPRKAEQQIRNSLVLPHGTGKTVKVLVFAEGDKADEARNAGADYVGLDDLVEKISGGWFDFDMVITTPNLMGRIGKLGRILGPRGLMPNPKVGTVTPDVATAVKNAKAGQVQFRVDKAGIVHASIGRRSFEPTALKSNLLALLEALNKAKPPASKGVYLKKVAVSSTMGAGVRVDQASLQAAA